MAAIVKLGKAALVSICLPIMAGAAVADDQGAVKCEHVASIGAAAMDADRVLSLRLRTIGPGPIGEGILVYRPGDKDYEGVIAHLGGIRPGETKLVRPWC